MLLSPPVPRLWAISLVDRELNWVGPKWTRPYMKILARPIWKRELKIWRKQILDSHWLDFVVWLGRCHASKLLISQKIEGSGFLYFTRQREGTYIYLHLGVWFLPPFFWFPNYQIPIFKLISCKSLFNLIMGTRLASIILVLAFLFLFRLSLEAKTMDPYKVTKYRSKFFLSLMHFDICC